MWPRTPESSRATYIKADVGRSPISASWGHCCFSHFFVFLQHVECRLQFSDDEQGMALGFCGTLRSMKDPQGNWGTEMPGSLHRCEADPGRQGLALSAGCSFYKAQLTSPHRNPGFSQTDTQEPKTQPRAPFRRDSLQKSYYKRGLCAGELKDGLHAAPWPRPSPRAGFTSFFFLLFAF